MMQCLSFLRTSLEQLLGFNTTIASPGEGEKKNCVGEVTSGAVQRIRSGKSFGVPTNNRQRQSQSKGKDRGGRSSATNREGGARAGVWGKKKLMGRSKKTTNVVVAATAQISARRQGQTEMIEQEKGGLSAIAARTPGLLQEPRTNFAQTSMQVTSGEHWGQPANADGTCLGASCCRGEI